MQQDRSDAAKPRFGKLGIAWIVGIVALLAISQGIGWFNDTTELTPDHSQTLSMCFIGAGVAGAVSVWVAISQSKGMNGGRRAAVAFGLFLGGALSVFLTLVAVSDVVESEIDFPAGLTRSYPALLQISRAYQTHGKGRSWVIQTMPIWSNIDITEQDYEFMAAHRRPGDASNPDNISSDGYFCARVTLQQAGRAIRVMHAGTHKLPQGTITVCPSRSGSVKNADVPNG